MNLKTWSKTILTVQKYLERVCNSIDGCIEKRVNASAFVTSKTLAENSSEAIANWIIEMSQRKVNLINLNVICMNALKGIDKTLAKILALKHFDNMPFNEIYQLLNISERTYFRKLNSAYQNFERWLIENGYSSEYFQSLLEKEGWIFEIYYENERQLLNTNKEIIFNLNNLNFDKICSVYR